MSAARRSRARADAAREVLESCLEAFDPDDALAADPLGIVHAQPPGWHVLAAHIAAPLAYGRATLIRQATVRVLGTLQRLEEDPVRLLESWKPGRLQEADPTFVYRMTRVDDLDAMVTGLAALQQGHGSLEAAFVANVGAGDTDLHPALCRYLQRMRAASGAPQRRGVRYLTPDGTSGSACKRGHLMLRWLVRPQRPDLGCWRSLPPSHLVMPIDTHIAWLSTAIGLTRRGSPDYRMAREITDHFRRWAPDDPLRYDMALCHVGLRGRCLHRPDQEHCPPCPLRTRCRIGRRISARLEPGREAV